MADSLTTLCVENVWTEVDTLGIDAIGIENTHKTTPIYFTVQPQGFDVNTPLNDPSISSFRIAPLGIRDVVGLGTTDRVFIRLTPGTSVEVPASILR